MTQARRKRTIVAGKAFWVSLIALALLILLGRSLVGEHTLYVLRGLEWAAPSRSVIVLFVLMICLCVWAMGKPKFR